MSSKNGWATRRVPFVVAGVAALAGLVGLLVWWLSRLPQIGSDEQVSRSVDALFTAITAHDEKLLTDCEHRLLRLKDDGKLPLEASDYLSYIVRKAHVGSWEPAAQSLYDFMRAQRRDGMREPSKERSRSKSPKR